MSEEVKLKPCPFCLSEYAQVHSDGGCVRFEVWCHKCRTVKYPVFAEGDKDTKEGAIRSWNRRIIKEK